MIVRTCN